MDKLEFFRLASIAHLGYYSEIFYSGDHPMALKDDAVIAFCCALVEDGLLYRASFTGPFYLTQAGADMIKLFRV